MGLKEWMEERIASATSDAVIQQADSAIIDMYGRLQGKYDAVRDNEPTVVYAKTIAQHFPGLSAIDKDRHERAVREDLFRRLTDELRKHVVFESKPSPSSFGHEVTARLTIGPDVQNLKQRVYELEQQVSELIELADEKS